jgi:chromosome segregation ATPase
MALAVDNFAELKDLLLDAANFMQVTTERTYWSETRRLQSLINDLQQKKLQSIKDERDELQERLARAEKAAQRKDPTVFAQTMTGLKSEEKLLRDSIDELQDEIKKHQDLVERYKKQLDDIERRLIHIEDLTNTELSNQKHKVKLLMNGTSIRFDFTSAEKVTGVVLTSQSVKPFEFDAAQSRTHVADDLWNMIGTAHGL